MRIGLIGINRPDQFADNIAACLPDLGHEVVLLGPASPATTSSLLSKAANLVSRFVTAAEAWQRHIVRRARSSDLDLVISTQATLLPSTVQGLSSSGTPACLWFPDPVSNLDRQLMLASPYQAIFFKDRLLVERLKNITGAPVHYLPEACNPLWHKPGPRSDVQPVVVVAGNLYPTRMLLLEHLHAAGIPLRLHSAGWPRWMPRRDIMSVPVMPEVYRAEKARVFRTAAAVLNSLQPGEMDSVNARLFEAAGCGGVILAEERPVLETVFDKKSELLTFSSADEVVDQARFALENPSECTALGDRAAERAHAQHTYQQRLDTLIDVVLRS